MTEFEILKQKLLAKKVKKPSPTKGLSSGCTLVNLAVTGSHEWCFSPGFYLLVGDSRSGKSFLCLTTLAEASVNPEFSKHRLLFYAPERGARMDIRKFFGDKLKKRIVEKYPETVEEFYYSLDDDLKKGPCVAVLDSMDALIPEDDQEKFKKTKTAHEKGKEEKGTYGTAKAKLNSNNLRQVLAKLEKTGSILIVISQTRDNIGFGAMFNPRTRSGGKALTFYATAEIWFSVAESIKKTVLKKQRKVGSVLRATVKKNRDTGREPSVDLLHYPDLGFDDVGSMVSWMTEENFWTVTDGKVNAPEFDIVGSEEKVIQKIESEGREGELRELVAKSWQEIETACAVQRKRRYS